MAKTTNKNKDPLDQESKIHLKAFERTFPFIAALLNHKAPGHVNTLLTTAGFLLPSPMQEKTHEFIIILVYASPAACITLKSMLSCAVPWEGYIWFPSTAFHLLIFFSLVHCLYWKGSQETCFSTAPNILSLLFLNALKRPGNWLALWSPATH